VACSGTALALFRHHKFIRSVEVNFYSETPYSAGKCSFPLSILTAAEKRALATC
jgi:hypothetical protein